MTQYNLSISMFERGTTIDGTIDDARKAAADYARSGDWDTSTGTVWVTVRIVDGEGEHVETVTVPIDSEARQASKA